MPQRLSFGTIIHRLLDEGLTTVNELGEVTGRGTSTIYRWMNDESEPHFSDMRMLVRLMKNPVARRTMVSLIASDLPIVVNWVADEPFTVEDDKGHRHDGHDVLDRTIMALDILTDILAQEHQAIRAAKLTQDSFARLVTMMDDAIRHVTASRNLLQKYRPVERPAPVAPPARWAS